MGINPLVSKSTHHVSSGLMVTVRSVSTAHLNIEIHIIHCIQEIHVETEVIIHCHYKKSILVSERVEFNAPPDTI